METFVESDNLVSISQSYFSELGLNMREIYCFVNLSLTQTWLNGRKGIWLENFP